MGLMLVVFGSCNCTGEQHLFHCVVDVAVSTRSALLLWTCMGMLRLLLQVVDFWWSSRVALVRSAWCRCVIEAWNALLSSNHVTVFNLNHVAGPSCMFRRPCTGAGVGPRMAAKEGRQSLSPLAVSDCGLKQHGGSSGAFVWRLWGAVDVRDRCEAMQRETSATERTLLRRERNSAARPAEWVVRSLLPRLNRSGSGFWSFCLNVTSRN